MKTKKSKVVLAYSGGLDTSVILKWLIDQGYEVIAYLADIGQKEDFKEAEAKAKKIGATKVYIMDLKKEFVTNYIFQALKGNALYEGRYLLGTSLARPLIAKYQIEIAKKEKAEYVSHGATGKGNDQVRFELTYYGLCPEIKVIAPWKEASFLQQFKGRNDLIAYAKQSGIPIKATMAAPYSEDENLMHISHEAGILEDPGKSPDEHVYSRTNHPKYAPDKETLLDIYFKDGLPVKVVNKQDGTVKEDPLELFLYLNNVGSENGIGRMDMVENRFVGIKSRGIYETPGGTILWAAHRDVEGIAMDREVMHLKDTLMPKFSELIYYGFWFSPEMDFLMAAINQSQKLIDGMVTVSLYKGNVLCVARTSPTSLYNEQLGSMHVEGGFDQTDSKGFIRLNAIRLKAHNVILDKRHLGVEEAIR
ncbi:argininosuccinate synthase [Candidatus Woesearchaeota archaeon]|nr:argininosuccinate synthase [Candidatus Woesearchaeota archaeon]